MNIFQKIVNFHKDLINLETPTSSRRYLAILFAYCVLGACFVNMFFKLTMSELMFGTMSTMALVYIGLATWTSNVQAKADAEVKISENKNNQ